MKKTMFLTLGILLLLPISAVYADYWIANVRGGLSYPLGDLGSNVDLSWNAGGSARKGFDREISAGGGVSYVTMPYKRKDAPTPFTATIIDAELSYAPYLPDFFIWPYAKLAIGLFLAKYAALTGASPDFTAVTKSETAFGIILGGGANYPLSNEIAANAEILYHQVSIQGGIGDNYTFFTFNAGITVFIK